MEGKNHKIDAAGQVFGRLASQIAVFLRGKHKASFLRYLDSGDGVAVFNVKKLKFTGKKFKQKEYFRHSGYPGGLYRQTLEEKFKKNPAKVLRDAVFGMLPKNRTRAKVIKRLKIFEGEE
jgi:large subunit ribosomal protein L13